ncbi:unnamed protein product [Absidia cylindrospora]
MLLIGTPQMQHLKQDSFYLAMLGVFNLKITYGFHKGNCFCYDHSKHCSVLTLFFPFTSLIDIFSPSVLDNNEAYKDKNHQLIEERKELKTQLILCANNLKRMKLSALDIRMYEKNEITQTHACLRLFSATASLVLQLPLFLPGLIINSPLYLLGRCIDHFEVYTESVAQDKVVSALALSIPLYGALFVILWKVLDYSLFGWLLGMVLVPLFAWYHITLVDKRYDMAKEVVASGRIFLAVTGLDHERRELEEAVKLRRWCLDRVKDVLQRLDLAGDPHAQLLVEYGQDVFKKYTPTDHSTHL